MSAHEGMMKSTAMAVFLLLALVASAAGAREPKEEERIGRLIAAVEGQQGAVFIRNGEEYDAKAAADHLRLKLKAAGDRVRTAEEFIRLCGSKSSISGRPYRIRFADGKMVDAETFLKTFLNTLPKP